MRFALAVWCSCAGGWFDELEAQDTKEILACQVPFLSYKGLSRGRTVLYEIRGQNIPDDQPIEDGFDSWTSRNASSGVSVSYVPGSTSEISGIVLTRGDAGSTDGLANYGSFDPTVSGGRVLGGSLVISDRTDRVTTGDGFRRITQHELGHAHGLDHWENVPQKISVMRSPNTFNGAALADFVTQCDGLRAFQREDN